MREPDVWFSGGPPPRPPLLGDGPVVAPRPPARVLTPREQAAENAEIDRENADAARAEEAQDRHLQEQERLERARGEIFHAPEIENRRPGDDHDEGYSYGDTDGGRGLGLGAGIGHHRGENVDADGPQINGGIGAWLDEDGEEHAGIRLNGSLARLGVHDPNPTNPAEMGGEMGSFDVGISTDDETLTMGAELNLGNVGATANVDDYSDFRSGNENDLAISGQAGFGPGGAVRIHHHGDRDGDEIPELGFGVSLCDFGFDVRSERLGRYYTNAANNIERGWSAARDWWNGEDD